MLSAVLGFFSQDLAVDLGSSTTRIYQRGTGVVCREPTVVAVQTDPRGRRRVHSVGAAARPLVGRAPADIAPVQPVRDGQVCDWEVAQALLLHLVRQVHGRNAWMRPRFVLPVPHDASEADRAALRKSCARAGARRVHLVPRPLAAALGSGMVLEGETPHLVVDIGGGSTEISVIIGSQILAFRALPQGGSAFDLALIDHLQGRHGLLIGAPSAESLKHTLGQRPQAPRTTPVDVRGRCLRTGRAATRTVSAGELQDALSEPVDAIAHALRRTLDQVPLAVSAALIAQGVVLTGGGSLLGGLEAALRLATGLPVVVHPDAENAVVAGAGQLLEDEAALISVGC